MLRGRRMLPLVTLALVAIPLFLRGDRVLAIEDEENKVLFGPVGIAPSERALLQEQKLQVARGVIGSVVGNPNELKERSAP